MTGGERKHVTVLFSDLSGYTSMSEKLDPEEVQEITTSIFSEAARIVAKYDGHLDKLIGDAVMVIFGVPCAHEDDPVRAIRTALELTEFVRELSPRIEPSIGRPVSMHSGIATGLVVTAQLDLEQGTERALGDTVNLASRLTDIAGPGEIVVGHETASQADRYFTFEALEPTKVKGKAAPIQPLRVHGSKHEPSTVHRQSGFRADLTGRDAELAEITAAITELTVGVGAGISICGEAGTGKSRLIEEVKSKTGSTRLQWLEGHCHAYAQNAPYSPLIDLLGRMWDVGEGDSRARVREKVEAGVTRVLGSAAPHAPYLGSLFGLVYPETEPTDPESWKTHLWAAVIAVLGELARQAPTVICFDDLHWADPSTMELLRSLSSDLGVPVVLVCGHRPPLNLSDVLACDRPDMRRIVIELDDLPKSDAQDMLRSLLGGTHIPGELQRLIELTAEGNPFYLEEVVNSLVDSGALVLGPDGWKLERAPAEIDVPLTIQGVLSSRLDRLDPETKSVLQQAAVIGRSFEIEILRRVTGPIERPEESLSTLQTLGLIQPQPLHDGARYSFKHALTQDVAYNGLLRRERQKIHEKVGLAIEELYADRLPEHFESLAHHFRLSGSSTKAVEYLAKSGDKSMEHYALDASDSFYREAFDILTEKADRTAEENALLVDLLVSWSLVHYYRGDFRTLEELLAEHIDLAESVGGAARLGMFHAWLGLALWQSGRFADSHRSLTKSLELGEETGNPDVIGHACTWLASTCADLDLLDEAVAYGTRARVLTEERRSDHYLYIMSMAGLQHAYWYKGDAAKIREVGQTLLNHGSKFSSIRSTTWGYYATANSYIADGDLTTAIGYARRALEASADPYLSQHPKFAVGMLLVMTGEADQAEAPLREVFDFASRLGLEQLATPSYAFLGLVRMSQGHLSLGMRMIEEVYAVYSEDARSYRGAMGEYIMGQVYAGMAGGGPRIAPAQVVKNAAFVVSHVPLAVRRAEAHFAKAVETARENRCSRRDGSGLPRLGPSLHTQR